MENIATAFRDSDGAGVFADLVRCLDFMNDLPFFKAYKAATWARLDIKKSSKILDVGCGVGFDVVEMAKLHPSSDIWGVDISDRFIEIARSRAKDHSNVKIFHGSSTALPFPSDCFDAIRIDRSLQHMDEPRSVIAEMIRVTRSGGRIVASEPDWGTLVLYNGEIAIGTMLCEQWKQSFRNPYIGRELGLIFADEGVGNIGCEVHPLCVTRFEDARIIFDLARVRAEAVKSGTLTDGEA